LKDNNYALKRLAKKRAEEEMNRTQEDIDMEREVEEASDNYNIDRGLKEREMDESLSPEQRESARFRKELRQKMARRQRK
jgi:hypothetical protein